jgi:tetratricopeptide (TPR) repeat protein
MLFACQAVTPLHGRARALRLYVEADDLIRRDSNRAAETLLRQAIAKDSEFASAQALLAWALHNDGRPPTDYQPIAAQAERLAAHATEVERLFIHGSSLWLHDKHDDACAVFEALHRVEPRHFWAATNLASCYQEKADRLRMSGAVDPFSTAEYLSASADLMPDDLARNTYAAWANEFIVTNPSRATRFRERAEALQRSGKYSNLGFPDAWLRFRLVYKHWLNDDVDTSYKSAKELIARDAPILDARPLDDLYYFAGAFLMTLGRLREAEHTFDLLTESSGANAVAAYARGDLQRSRQLFSEFVGLPYDGPGGLFGALFARLG